jgi:hypothetical protein
MDKKKGIIVLLIALVAVWFLFLRDTSTCQQDPACADDAACEASTEEGCKGYVASCAEDCTKDCCAGDDDGIEGDGTEGDGTEGDGTEGDGTEGDGTEGDGTEGDGTEGDGTEGNGADTK